MGTRSTQTVGAVTAAYAIEAALSSGRLSHKALADLLEIVDDDLNTPEMSNFIVVNGQGEDDDEWVAWRERLRE
jgi:hypothetical protein